MRTYRIHYSPELGLDLLARRQNQLGIIDPKTKPTNPFRRMAPFATKYCSLQRNVGYLTGESDVRTIITCSRKWEPPRYSERHTRDAS